MVGVAARLLIDEPANVVEAIFAFYEAQEMPAEDEAASSGALL